MTFKFAKKGSDATLRSKRSGTVRVQKKIEIQTQYFGEFLSEKYVTLVINIAEHNLFTETEIYFNQ